MSLLKPLEQLYRRVVMQQRLAYASGAKTPYRAPVPVLVVGNITVGGTGKTPLILWLIEHCRRQGWRVGVVSRGYGAKAPHYPWRVEASGNPAECGDEPLMLVQRCAVPLMIDPLRSRAVQALLEQTPLDIILSDDGLQHHALGRDWELVVIDHARGFGNGRCLPAGPLREPLERLHDVDACILNGALQDDASGYAMQLRPSALVNLKTGERQRLSFFPAEQRLHAVAGIGNPERFFTTLEGLNWRPIRHAFADHAPFNAAELPDDDLPLVMTEKDAVKCRSFARDNWWYLAVDAELSAAFGHWLTQQLQVKVRPHSS
nr:tetraacyldisaccharide 4'-kinase [Atopomonas sediminilitoris]